MCIRFLLSWRLYEKVIPQTKENTGCLYAQVTPINLKDYKNEMAFLKITSAMTTCFQFLTPINQVAMVTVELWKQWAELANNPQTNLW